MELWWLFFLIIFVIPIALAKKKRGGWFYLHRVKKTKGGLIMVLPEEFVSGFLNKLVFIKTIDSFDTGTISDIKDGWIKITDKKGKHTLINIETIISIAER